MGKRIKTIGIISLIIIFAGLVYFSFLSGKSSPDTVSQPPHQTKAILSARNITIFFKGETGKDALTLLKEHAKVEQDSTGLVTSINGKKADTAKHQYWTFTVNNKLAPIGPADYQTNNSDKIEWKIETY